VPRRVYGQFCGLARAFDVVGERWTALLLRELSGGPRRYSELAKNLGGIGTSLLASRLRALERDDLVRRTTVGNGPSQLYELTQDGVELAASLAPLAQWGLRRLGVPGRDEAFNLSSLIWFVRATANADAAVGLHDIYEVHVGGHVLHVLVHDGSVAIEAGPAPLRPDLAVHAPPQAFAAIAAGRLSPWVALSDGVLTMTGDLATLRRCMRILAPHASASARTVHS